MYLGFSTTSLFSSNRPWEYNTVEKAKLTTIKKKKKTQTKYEQVSAYMITHNLVIVW